jgi:phosphoglycerate kinase
MVTSHLGRPTEGEFKPEDSLAPVAKRLSELLGQPVELKQNWVDGAGLEGLQAGQVVLLENVRVNKGEKKNSDELAQKMAALCDIYVNDAFGTAHRAEASTHGIAKFAPVACAGPLLAAELDALGKALGARPSAAGHRGWLESVDQADHPESAGRQGGQPDRRRRHRQHLHAGCRPEDRQVAGRAGPGDAKAIIDIMAKRGAQVPIPVDVVCAKEFSPTAAPPSRTWPTWPTTT